MFEVSQELELAVLDQEEATSSFPPTPEQQRVIDSWGSGLAVLAGAGSGKTTTLVAKCARLIELRPEARFAAVSFTERSAGDLRAKLSEKLLKIRGPGAMNPHWVMTIHGLCGSIIREFPREAGFDGEESVLPDGEAQVYWERAIESLWLDPLPDEIREAFESLLDRESRDGLAALLKRVRELNAFGVRQSLGKVTDPHSLALQLVSSFVLEKYERLKRRRGALDFNDLEKGADRALEQDHVRAHYHRKFDLVLVDEFQDTNPVQARLIWKLVRPNASNLCVVGDPKQSIYRFRDADVTVFEEFCARLPTRHSLTWNFRSLPGIIHFTNQICDPIFEASGLTYEPLIPKRENPDPNTETVLRLEIESPQQLGQWIRQQQEGGIPLHEMALLVRKIRGNEKWFKALTAAQIPIAIGSGGLFWEEPRVRELVAFLKWWDNPGNSFSGGVFLRAPWMGVPDRVLDQWVKQDPTWRGPFFSYAHPIVEALKPWTQRQGRPGELLMALLVSQEVEDELGAPLLGLWHRVEELSARGMDFHGVVREISSAIEQNRREREVPAPRQLGQLPVLTLHSAKGLEFSQVILIDFSGPTRASDTPLLFWDREQGAYLATRDSNGDRKKTDPVENQWRELEKAKNLAESKRLFYVALTRAQNRLVLVCPVLAEKPAVKSTRKNALDHDAARASFLRDDWRGWIDHGKAKPPCESPRLLFREEGAATSNEAPPPVLDSPVQALPASAFRKPREWTRARHSVTEWNLLARCPQAYEWTFIRPRLVAPEVSAPLEPSALQGTHQDPVHDNAPVPDTIRMIQETVPKLTDQELGNRVHLCLERGDYDGLRELEKEAGPSRFVADPLIHWARNSAWMVPADPASGREVWSELNFEVPLDREILVGSIDRVVMHQDASGETSYCIIDFKVTANPKPVGSLLEAYRHQLELYAWALTRLDPSIQLHQIKMLLVNISTFSIQPIAVSVGRISVPDLKAQSLRIIGGEPGYPQAGPLCRVCQFQSECPEGQKWIAPSAKEI